VRPAWRPRLRSILFWSLVGLGLLPLAVHLAFHAPGVFALLDSAAVSASREHASAQAHQVAQHLERRAETARIIAALPGPQEILGAALPQGTPGLSAQEVAPRFTGAMQRWLGASEDVAEILLIDRHGQEQLRLVREGDLRGFAPAAAGSQPSGVPVDRLDTGDGAGAPAQVLAEDAAPGQPVRAPRMFVSAPLRDARGQALGTVVLALRPEAFLPDPQAGRWVLADGRYLLRPGQRSARQDFPTLAGQLGEAQPFTLVATRGPDHAWTPVVLAGAREPALWAVMPIDRAAVRDWMGSLGLTSALTTIALLAGVLVVALVLARRVDHVKGQILEGMGRLVRGDTSVRFDWGGPAEVRELGQGLSSVARRYGLALEERRAAEAALLDEQERARITLASIADAVLSTDRDGRVEFANDQALGLLGAERRELLGRPVGEVVRLVDLRGQAVALAPRDPPGVDHPSAGDPGGVGVLRLGERSVPVECSAAPIRDRAGERVGWVVVLRDVSQREQLERQLSHQASHDSLTGLANRRAFDQHLAHALDSARSRGAQHALLYIDLDQFKVVNDTCGHLAGDELLKQLARVMQAHVRAGDVLARLGGDEFGVLLRDCPAEKALVIAETLLGLVREHRFRWQGGLFTVGASIGVAPIQGTGQTAAEVLAAADMACHGAKDQGRGRVQVWRESDRELEKRRTEMQWVGHVKRALEEDRFVLYCQHVVPLGDPGTAPSRFEILVRMVDDQGGLIPPGAFIPAAERYNEMPALDRWVVARVFEWMRAWLPGLATEATPVFNINLSGNSLCEPGFLEFVAGQARGLGALCRSVCFEVTETAAIAHLAAATDFIDRLRVLGFQFALDDFGSGLSSFGYLKHLKVDSLKIDGIFIRDLHRDPVDLALVRAMNEVGHAMGITTVAEYVESEEVLALLRAVGVDYGQGYALAKPMPLSDLESGALARATPVAPLAAGHSA
jgi:diguanylate cyclase (GGDEF)-like protein/PAS domain S-box-containing protein